MINERAKPVILAVLDGWGVAPAWGGNAITLAKTPFINMIAQHYPHTTLNASGTAVGLPDNERGNSEVGHLTIGSGQVVMESLPSITAAIEDGSFFTNQVLTQAFTRAAQSQHTVHLMGLVSDGGIHSHISHLYALIDMAKRLGVTKLVIHAFTDGRDTPPFVSQLYLSRLNQYMVQAGVGKICTVSGRYYAMDRDHRFERTEKVYRAMTEGVGVQVKSAEGAVAAAYREGYSDEFIVPSVITGEGNNFTPIKDNDSVIFFNFRGDRARQIAQAIIKPDFDGFKRNITLKNIFFVGFTFYQEGLPIEVAFKPRDVRKPLAAVISEQGLRQLHVAESEKYAHVTYFFNGGSESAFQNEDRIVVPSQKVASYDLRPEMSADDITQVVINNLDAYDFIVVNFANPDMVGHTGNFRATVTACEKVDECLGKIYAALKAKDALFIITADHGNAEQMVNPKTGEPDTEHSNNPVPFYLVGDRAKNYSLRAGGGLSDIAPTLIDLLGITDIQGMSGQSLILNKNTEQTTSESDLTVGTLQT